MHGNAGTTSANPLTVTKTTTVTCTVIVTWWNQASGGSFLSFTPAATQLNSDTGDEDRNAYIIGQVAGTYSVGANFTTGDPNDTIIVLWLPETVASSVVQSPAVLQPVPRRPAVGGLGGFDAPELQTWQSNANPVSNIVPIVATYAQQPPQLAIPMLPTAGGFVLGTPPQQSNAAPVAQAIVASLTPPPLVMEIPMRRGVTSFTIGLPPRGDTSAPVPKAITVSGTVPYPQNLIPMHRGPNGLFTRGKPPQGATNSVAPTPPPPPTGNGGGIINRRRRR